MTELLDGEDNSHRTGHNSSDHEEHASPQPGNQHLPHAVLDSPIQPHHNNPLHGKEESYTANPSSSSRPSTSAQPNHNLPKATQTDEYDLPLCEACSKYADEADNLKEDKAALSSQISALQQDVAFLQFAEERNREYAGVLRANNQKLWKENKELRGWERNVREKNDVLEEENDALRAKLAGLKDGAEGDEEENNEESGDEENENEKEALKERVRVVEQTVHEHASRLEVLEKVARRRYGDAAEGGMDAGGGWIRIPRHDRDRLIDMAYLDWTWKAEHEQRQELTDDERIFMKDRMRELVAEAEENREDGLEDILHEAVEISMYEALKEYRAEKLDSF